ncbi:MAG: NAD(P)/FAD-dependent oxidoreductase [Candidatus Melainabacteria bacterium]|nr:NAD(P)/FAD-dependent oxidoreductase [Candidatus Melainabacteria bacterium]
MVSNNETTAIIIGAGPAGLTAAYELLLKTDIQPIIYEMSGDIGGIAKTVNYKGNRIDMGGHRFFSKSDRVMQWWQNILPLAGAPSKDDLILNISYQNKNRAITLSENGPDPEKTDLVMLIRRRLSRIFFLRQFFDYPISLNLNTISNLGIVRIIRIGLSYIKVKFFPIKIEKSLEDFFINRFGRELYLTFFKDYTEKIWGVPCSTIKPEWGAQRIKGLSITKAIIHAVKSLLLRDKSIAQKNIETSLIEQFLYPKLGPGQMWEETVKIIKNKGGQICMHHRVIGIKLERDKVIEVTLLDESTGKIKTQKGDYFFSTMPVKELIECMGDLVPSDVYRVAQGLMYRDFITVGLLLKNLKIKNKTNLPSINDIVPDNWIYIQERDVKIGRLQIFNNWSPYMVKDPNTAWIGLEYFCNVGDELWNKKDDEFIKFAIDELCKIDIIEKENVLDSTIIRLRNTYPAYFGSYDQFNVIRQFTDKIENLFLIGRNGMHRYNNQDHSMLSAMTAVENIINGIKTKDNIWEINVEMEYHEEKSK